jgi:hypothetical protein
MTVGCGEVGVVRATVVVAVVVSVVVRVVSVT